MSNDSFDSIGLLVFTVSACACDARMLQVSFLVNLAIDERGRRVSGASCLLVGQINSPQPCFVQYYVVGIGVVAASEKVAPGTTLIILNRPTLLTRRVPLA